MFKDRDDDDDLVNEKDLRRKKIESKKKLKPIVTDEQKFINKSKKQLKKQKEEGTSRKLVGFELTDKGIARGHYLVKDADGTEIGVVTSGTMSPSSGKSIGLAYVPVSHSKPGSQIFIDVRGRNLAAEVVSLPFFKS